MVIANLFAVWWKPRRPINPNPRSNNQQAKTAFLLKLHCLLKRSSVKKHNNLFITGGFSLISVWKEMGSREKTENSLNLFKKDRDRHLICGAFFCANLSVKPSSWGGFFFCYIKHHQKKVKSNPEGEFLSMF